MIIKLCILFFLFTFFPRLTESNCLSLLGVTAFFYQGANIATDGLLTAAFLQGHLLSPGNPTLGPK